MEAEEAIEAMFEASREGEASELVRLLDQSQQLLVDTKNEDGTTLLMLASARGHVDVVRVLLERGADLSARDKYEASAILYAANNGRDEVVNLLLGNGADVRSCDEHGHTVLMEAAAGRSANALKRVLQAMGCQGLDEVNYRHRTALWEACSDGYEEGVQMLLLWGADHTIADNIGKTPGDIAAEEMHENCVKVIEVRIHFPWYDSSRQDVQMTRDHMWF
jgi:ankyrin repeat protein